MKTIDQEKIHSGLLNLKDGTSFVVDDRYICAFDKQCHDVGFSQFTTDDNCHERCSSYANVAVYDMQEQMKLCGKMVMSINNDRENKYSSMLFIKQYGKPDWQYSITVTSVDIMEN